MLLFTVMFAIAAGVLLGWNSLALTSRLCLPRLPFVGSLVIFSSRKLIQEVGGIE